mgnify:CR=1 FL=1
MLKIIDKKSFKRLLEVGTGSGCIIISIMKERLNCRATAIDISKKAINIAKFNENAVNLNTIMGKRVIDDDMYKKLGQKFIDNGATILGGCCETSPKHTKILSNLR